MKLKRLWDPQLSQREVAMIGLVAVHWAAMEHEVFSQTLATFADEASRGAVLPKEMNNIQFTGVLELWKERVALLAKTRRQKVLLSQYDEIHRLKPYRDALIHGMWHWSESDLGALFTTRVQKRDVITVKFSVDDLAEFSSKIAEVNFNIRFPGGMVDLARTRARDGGYMSRRAVAVFSGAPVDEEGFPVAHPGAAGPTS
jgi:hypothetical protein